MVAYLERALHGIAGRKPEKLEVARKVLGRHGWGAALATADNLSLGEDDSDDWPTFALWTAALDCGHEDAW